MTKFRAFAAAITLAAFATALNADVSNKKTKVTFSAPVQIPGPHAKGGVVTLPAGTYVFRLIDSSSSRHIVEVTNLRENHVYSTIIALNDYRLNATSKTVMYFTERQSGTPPAVKAWFYPGDNYGQRFVYPKVQAVQIAAAVNQPVPAHEAAVVEKATVDTPVVIETPAKQETAYTAAAFEKHDATDTAGVDGEAVKEASTGNLPKTGSSLQLIGMMGLLLLAVSFLLRRVSIQMK